MSQNNDNVDRLAPVVVSALQAFDKTDVSRKFRCLVG
jgi:hypothetical protein